MSFWTAHEEAQNFINGVALGMERFGHFYSQTLYGDADGFVYFITIGDPYITHVKVGYTTKDPAVRMAMLQTGCPFKMKMLGFVIANRACEQELHAVLKDDRTEGEWFVYSEYVESVIRRHLDEER
jgi:hypothetical protein